MDDIDKDGFRANVGIILSSADDTVFLGGRTRQKGWQFPQGGIQVNESPEEAMYRELEEEIGLKPDHVEVMGISQCWLRYELPRKYVRHNVKPVCIGQKQQWFLLRLTAGEGRLCLDTTDAPEFDRWRWVDFWHPIQEVIYFKRKVYFQALSELGPVLFPSGTPPQPDWWPEEWRLNHHE